MLDRHFIRISTACHLLVVSSPRVFHMNKASRDCAVGRTTIKSDLILANEMYS